MQVETSLSKLSKKWEPIKQPKRSQERLTKTLVIDFVNSQKISDEKKEYFKSLLKKEPIKSSNLSIYYVDDYKTKLNKENSEELEKNINWAKQYTSLKIVKQNRNKILFIDNDRLKKELKIKEEKLKQIICEDKQGFLKLLGNKIYDPNDFFKLFTFDYDKIFKKEHIQTIFNLTKLFNEDKINRITTKQDMIDNNLWNIPSFNAPRDLILSSEESLDKFIKDSHISPEYRLMKFLLENKIINHNFNENEIDYILSIYRCCVFGLNNDIIRFRNNPKYYDANPYISSYDCKLNNEICEKNKKNEFTWNVLNNMLGIHTAGIRTTIFPYMAISNDLPNRYETSTFNISDENIGLFVFEFPNEKLIICYFKIIDNQLRFFDINDNRIYPEKSLISSQRVQLLESKWAIARLLSFLENSKIVPFNKKPCDIIVYKVNKKHEGYNKISKDMYLLSLYDYDEIIKMYNDFKDIIGAKILDIDIKNQLNYLIQTFIDEFNSYEKIDNYRLFNDQNQSLFIWQIKEEELHLWNYDGKILYYTGDNYKSKNSKCIYSDIYTNIINNEIDYNKLDSTKIGRIFKGYGDETGNIFYDTVRYHQESEYKKYIDKQKELIIKYKYIKYKTKYLNLK